jgi:hypothetical protein
LRGLQVTNRKPGVIAASIALTFFLLGRLTASEDLVDEIPRRGEKVVSFSGGAIGSEEARELVPEGASKEHAKAVLETLVRTRVLAGRAEDADLHLSPAFLSRYADELAGLYVAERFEKPFQKQLPTDDEVKKFFEENKTRLGRAERVRLAHIALLASKGDASARGKRRAEALQILAELRRARGDEYAFGRLAMARSEDGGSRGVGGELPFMSREEVAARLGPEVAAAAFAAKVGVPLDGPIETEQGFQIVNVVAREEGREASFDELREPIRARLTAERHEKAFKAFMGGVWADASVKFDEKALDRLIAEAGKKRPGHQTTPGAGSR